MRRYAVCDNRESPPVVGGLGAGDIELQEISYSTPAAAEISNIRRGVANKNASPPSAMLKRPRDPRKLRRVVSFAPEIQFAPQVSPSWAASIEDVLSSPLTLSSPSLEPESGPEQVETPPNSTPPFSPTPRRRKRESLSARPPTTGPLPNLPIDQHSDAILAMCARKRCNLGEAEMRFRTSAGGATVAFFSTLGLCLALAFILPTALLDLRIPLAIKIILPPALWATAISMGVWIERARIRTGAASLRVDKASVRSLILNLSRLITDLDGLPHGEPARRILLDEACGVLADATNLDRLYDGQEYLYNIVAAILFGPVALLLHALLVCHCHACGWSCCAWLLGFDGSRQFVKHIGRNITPWGMIELETPNIARKESIEV